MSDILNKLTATHVHWAGICQGNLPSRPAPPCAQSAKLCVTDPTRGSAYQKVYYGTVHVCCWHLADIPPALTNVRYGGKSGHDTNRPLWRLIPIADIPAFASFLLLSIPSERWVQEALP